MVVLMMGFADPPQGSVSFESGGGFDGRRT